MMGYNSTIDNRPPAGRECKHPCCGSTCRKKKDPKPRKPIAKVSAKRKAGWFDAKATEENNTNEQWKWFEERRKEMTGRCKHCNGRTTKDDNEKFHFSVCHILPKAYFHSVATHEYNFIELCSFGNNCHGNMDSKMLDLTEMNCWDEIVTKFCIIYPSIAKEEKRRIPSILMQYIEVEN